METAGTVVVQITGNLGPLEAALAKGQQMAAAFNAQIEAKLSGAGLSEGLAKIAAGVDATNALLTKLTTSSAGAGLALSKVATSTAATTAALSGVATATKLANAELSTLGSGGGAGLAAGTIAARDFAAALEATGGRLDKITPGMLGLATGTEAVAVANTRAAAGMTEVALGAEGVGAASKRAAVGMEALGVSEAHAAGLGAGVTREFSVLGAEIARGNFSRIPGSLIVMNERLVSSGAGVLTLANGMKALGGLASVVFNPFVLGFLALSFGADLAVKALGSIGSGAKDVNTILKDHKALIDEITAAYPAAAAAAKVYDDQAAKVPVSVAAADTFKTIEEEQKKSKALISDLSNSLTVLGNDYTAFGSAGSAAFVKLGEELKSGDKTASDVQKTLGDLRIDPSLNKNAHEFATWLQEAATEAAKIELHLAGAEAAGNIFKVRGGHPDFGVGDNILANMVSAGNAAAEALKNVQDSLGTTGMTAYAAAVARINQQFDAQIAKVHAVGAAFDTFNQARSLSIQEASLKALGGITFDTPIAGANALGIALTTAGQAANNAKVSIGNIAAPVVNMTQLLGAAKLDQLIGLESATSKLEEYKVSLTHVAQALEVTKNLSASFFGDAFKGTQTDITGAYDAIDNVFKLYDSGKASVKAVHDEIERVRATLIALGGDRAGIKEFIDDVVNGETKTRQLNSDVQTLGHSIATLPNKTVTITIKTQTIGSGTQSIYDVPNFNGSGTSGVGVTRYGAAPGSQSGPSLTANEVQSSSGGSEGAGYGSSYGVGSGTGTVTVTRFGGTRAAGGPVAAGLPYWVGERGPELVVPQGAGTVVPSAQSAMFAQALASAQSGFTGRQPTQDQDRLWTVLMNVESNTRRTFQILDDIKTSTAASSSALGGSSSGGSSSGATGQSDPLAQQYLDVLKTIKSNFAAAGIVGSGQVGYNSNGLGATAEQIARNIVYGGQSQVGSASGYVNQNGGQSYTDPTARARLAAMNPRDPGYAAAYGSVYGFDSGGMIGGGAGDTQKVEFFKNPNEKVIIARPDQFTDARAGPAAAPSSSPGDRPITISMPIYIQGGAQVSKESTGELRRQAALAVREAMRSINGR